MVKLDEDLYPFYQASIHERRTVARLLRAFPLACTLGFVAAIVYGCFKDEYLLLTLCAVLNVAFWLWIVSTCCFGIAGSWCVADELKKYKKLVEDRVTSGNRSPFSSPRADIDSDSVTHLIVYPNYKEGESILAETLQSLSEAEDAHRFHVVLACEERETGVAEKAARLQDRFPNWSQSGNSGFFATLSVTMHPENRIQDHLDSSVDLEVPGKASNLKWAVNESYQMLKNQGADRVQNVILTVADADCLFHPNYFSAVSKDFNALREKPEKEHEWCMWQAPQLSYRDHWEAPIPSRVWTYISSMYEFGGVSGLYWGGHHMVFSGYSMPLHLAVAAQSWDGDIIAEDHHAYIKNFFYSAWHSAMKATGEENNLSGDGCQPKLQVRPIFLPVKSTPVISSEGYWQTYVERWHQAKRHAQGIAELPYAMLVMWDTLASLPISAYSFQLFYRMFRIWMRLMCMHLLPTCQGIGLGIMTLYWLWHNRTLDSCPKDMHLQPIVQGLESDYPLCALGGAWTLIWPMAIPVALVMIANYTMVSASFLMPAREGPESKWQHEDSSIPAYCGSRNFTAFFLIVLDCTFFLSIMMVPYGLVAVLVAMWNVCFYGNRFEYITAARVAKEQHTAYGTMCDTSDAKQQADP
jgi:hypothetical protein